MTFTCATIEPKTADNSLAFMLWTCNGT